MVLVLRSRKLLNFNFQKQTCRQWKLDTRSRQNFENRTGETGRGGCTQTRPPEPNPPSQGTENPKSEQTNQSLSSRPFWMNATDVPLPASCCLSFPEFQLWNSGTQNLDKEIDNVPPIGNRAVAHHQGSLCLSLSLEDFLENI